MIVKNFVCHLFSIVPSPQSRDHKEPAGTSLLGLLKVFDTWELKQLSCKSEQTGTSLLELIILTCTGQK
jgi:hypothetical protein